MFLYTKCPECGNEKELKSAGRIDPANRIEQIAIKLDTPYMKRMQREIKAVEDAYSKLREDYKKIIRIRFWSDRYKNMPYKWMTRCVSYSERQIRRVCKAFVREVGENLGEL